MKLYENGWSNIYEEIKTWYPVWYREVAEMDALWRVWGGQLDAAQAGIVRAVDNHFLDFADAQTIARLESWLGIAYDGPRTLEDRRTVVKAFFYGIRHIGRQEIKAHIALFTRGEAAVEFSGGLVRVTVWPSLADRFNLYDCRLPLDNRIPAHLALEFSVRVDMPPLEQTAHAGAAMAAGVSETALPGGG